MKNLREELNFRNTILNGDAKEQLALLPDGCIDCCVTSPPYWGLRDYGVTGQLGLETTPEEYVQNMAEVFREVKRILKNEGTLFLNIGDSYFGSGRGNNPNGKQGTNKGTCFELPSTSRHVAAYGTSGKEPEVI